MKQRDDEVAVITTAPEAPSDAMGARERRYIVSMSIRTACFIGACLVEGPLRWVLIVGAIVLPYVSVVLANAGVRMRGASGSDFVPMEHHAIGSRSDAPNEL
ncbi:MAG: DUF3099 domain-containing protein [Aeromicrobium sp.]|uniref:DUF3099 domain-containing protein n=1 Tax=Aeromicrobium sp. TaxID=1871063 RepID=UPI0039E6E907